MRLSSNMVSLKAYLHHREVAFKSLNKVEYIETIENPIKKEKN